MKPYSMDLRERVIAACDQPEPTLVVAKKFKVSPSWVRRLKQHRRERGDIVPRTGGGPPKYKIDRGRLAELVRLQPDATLAELREKLGIDVSLWGIGKALRALKLTYKKSRFTPPNRIGPTSPRRGRHGG